MQKDHTPFYVNGKNLNEFLQCKGETIFLRLGSQWVPHLNIMYFDRSCLTVLFYYQMMTD